MARGTTDIRLIIKGFTLLADTTHHWKWNNANKAATHCFQVWTFNSQNNPHLLYRAQVKNVRSLWRKPNELEIYFDVYNWGTVWTDYYVYGSIVTFA